MSAFSSAEKLRPARKAWKSLKNHFRSKLNRSNILNSIKTFRRHFSITKRSPPYSGHHFRQNNSTIYVDQLFPGPVPIAEPRKVQENMDGLFPGPVDKSGPPHNNSGNIQTRRVGDNKVSVELIPGNDEKGKDGRSSKCSSADDKWKVPFPVPPRFRCIDERAEEFIAKFRQEMHLEREQSILEFEEMLKRSA
ncbi:hypothetical protein OROHE_016600 [Orobanche hederae]